MGNRIFASCAPKYRTISLEPRPIDPNSKACKIKGWTKPDTEFDQAELAGWINKFADSGIGLRMGTPLSAGGVLGAIDVDNNAYVRLVKALLRDPVSERFGSKGAAFFVRVVGNVKNAKFSVKGEIKRNTVRSLSACLTSSFASSHRPYIQRRDHLTNGSRALLMRLNSADSLLLNLGLTRSRKRPFLSSCSEGSLRANMCLPCLQRLKLIVPHCALSAKSFSSHKTKNTSPRSSRRSQTSSSV